MKIGKLWVGEAGCYEDNGAEFVAVSPEMALEYLQHTYPHRKWKIDRSDFTVPRADIFPEGEYDHCTEYYRLRKVEFAIE